MQKNPCRVDDPLQNPIDRETYEDAVSLEDGIYPITTDDSTIISSDMVSHGSGTVEQALNVTTGQATVPTGMFSSVAYNKIVKKGNLVFVQFGGVLASGVTGSNTVVLNIPSAFRASQSERLFSSLTYNDSLLVAYLCGTDSSGDVVLSVGSGQVTGLISIMGVYTI